MSIEPEISNTLIPWNFVLSLGGSFVAGVGLILTFGRKWQTFEDMKREIADLKKELKDAKENCTLSDAKIEAEISMIKDNSAAYREAAVRSFATREELSRLEDKIWARLANPLNKIPGD